VQVASAVPGSSGGVGSFFSNLFGAKTEDQGAASRTTQPAEASASKSKPAASAKAGHSAAGAARPKSAPAPAETKTANAAATKASPSKQDAEPQKDTGSATGQLSGAAPAVPSGGFDSRFGAWN
jgi:Neuraminidase (sialidase)